MNITEAITEAARHFASVGNYNPSHCDVRCYINDAIADNPVYYRKGYNQDLAHKRVLNLIANSRVLEV